MNDEYFVVKECTRCRLILSVRPLCRRNKAKRKRRD